MTIEPVDITPTALDAVKAIMAKKSIPEGYGLRIFVTDQGISCGATNYSLGFDKETDTDLVYAVGDLKVIVKKMEAVHLAGLILDYVTEDSTSGFSLSRDN